MAHEALASGVTRARRAVALLFPLVLLLPLAPLPEAQARTLEMGEPVVMRAAAVAETPEGFVGSTATITITAASNGSGHIFLDTFPLSEVDMQGSARLAARVASQLAGKRLAEHDFFFVLRSGSQIIGGPSAGATMAVGAVAALNGWTVRPDVLMTGTIQPDGGVGPVGGIPEKAQAAAQAGMTRFLFPQGEEIVAFQADPRRTFNLTDHCARVLRIECVPVADVMEAVGLMTDHAFVRPPLSGNVTGEAYRALLTGASHDLVENAQALLVEARADVARLPAGEAKRVLEARLEVAAGLVQGAREAEEEGLHYTASSRGFQAGIEARQVRDAARLVGSDDPLSFATGVVDEARREVQSVRPRVERFPGLTTTTFEAAGAAQVRLLEAEARLARAEALLAQGAGSVVQALNEAAWAQERARTVLFWLRISEGLPEGEPLEERGVRDAARDTLTTSREEVAYVRAVFTTRGIGGDVGAAEAKLAAAEAAMERGFLSAAMFEALEASVRASVLLEALGHQDGIPATVLERKEDQAARAIQAARERGVEPFLAQSQYEFGVSLENPLDRLVFLGLARVTANLAVLPGVYGEPRAAESRFVGEAPALGVPPTWVAAAFAVGLALGVGSGLAALMPREEKPKKKDAEPVPRDEPAPPW